MPIAARFSLAVLAGIVAGVLISGAVEQGAAYMHQTENPWETWGILFWGDHHVLRFVASIVATVGGAFIAGVIARSRGQLAGALSTTPTAVIWAVGSYLALTAPGVAIGTKIVGVLAAVATIPAALPAGEAGAKTGIIFGPHFDSRPGTLLGIKWFHYLWIPILINLVVMQTAWILLYAAGWLKLAWAAGSSLWGIIPSIFLAAIYGTLWLTATGFYRAYVVLAALAEVPTAAGRALEVLKYGVGFPILAAILQGVIALLHYALGRLI